MLESVFDILEEIGFELRRLLRGRAGILTWRLVRSIGELQILTRVYYAAAVVVPILATIWPGIHYFINKINDVAHTGVSETLPMSWALGFFAALLTIVANFLYQAAAPEIVRQRTMSQFTRDQIEDYKQNPVYEKLQAAIDFIERAGMDRIEYELDKMNRTYEAFANILPHCRSIFKSFG
jgi:hypothetical protein